MIKYKFDGSGDFFTHNLEEAALIHAEGVISDYTLCGLTLDLDEATLGSFDEVDAKISCPTCIAIINHCKSIPAKEMVRCK